MNNVKLVKWVKARTLRLEDLYGGCLYSIEWLLKAVYRHPKSNNGLRGNLKNDRNRAEWRTRRKSNLLLGSKFLFLFKLSMFKTYRTSNHQTVDETDNGANIELGLLVMVMEGHPNGLCHRLAHFGTQYTTDGASTKYLNPSLHHNPFLGCKTKRHFKSL